MGKVTVALAQRSRWQMAGVRARLVDPQLLWPDGVRRRNQIRKARSNRNLVVGRQSLPGRGNSSIEVVINNPSPAVGVVEKGPATRECQD
jgi:hypothetical protein